MDKFISTTPNAVTPTYHLVGVLCHGDKFCVEDVAPVWITFSSPNPSADKFVQEFKRGKAVCYKSLIKPSKRFLGDQREMQKTLGFQ